MADWLDKLHPSLRPLWDLENELRKAAQNAIFLKNDEAKLHLAEARRHFAAARSALTGETPVRAADDKEATPVITPPPEHRPPPQ